MNGDGAIRTDVAVVGGGPAGSTIATRLAQMGHDVLLVERSRFPRRAVGESLTPGVLPLLEASGARALVEAAGFPRPDSLDVDWDAGPARRRGPAGEGGLLVDRGRFDAVLLDHARDAGVRVLQPAVARRPEERDGSWRIPVDVGGRRVVVEAPFLALAGGRAPRTRSRRLSVGSPTIALQAWWVGDRLPDVPRIVAAEDGWAWGVPIPDGSYDTLVFVDPDLRDAGVREPLARRFRRLVVETGLLEGSVGARLCGSVRALDATPYLHEDSVGERVLRVGDAALALDPLSSSGVQRAIQSAVAGAVVANTILRRPERTDLAAAWHRDALRHAFERHASWAADHYAAAAARRSGTFWRTRAARATTAAAAEAPPTPSACDWSSATPLRISPRCAFVEVPCLEGDLVASRSAVTHPALDAPVAWLAGTDFVPLLRSIPADASALRIVQAWSARLPARTSFAILEWLVRRGLVETGSSAEILAASVPAGG